MPISCPGGNHQVYFKETDLESAVLYLHPSNKTFHMRFELRRGFRCRVLYTKSRTRCEEESRADFILSSALPVS